MEVAKEQMFKRDLWMAQRLRNGVFVCRGHDGEFTFMVKHGLLMGTSAAPRIFSWGFDKTFERWKMSHQTPSSTMLSAPSAGMEGSKVDGSWSGLADDLFTKDEILDHTAETAKDTILNNASSLDEDAGRGQVQTELAQAGDRARVSADTANNDASLRWFFSGRSWAGLGISEGDIHPTGATKWN